MRVTKISALLVILLAGCAEPVTRGDDSRILAMGDSMLAWNRLSNNSVADVIEESLGEKVTDRSVVGARFNYLLPISGAMGLNISKQYRVGSWDWVIVNGGGNDLWFGCGCIACDYTTDKIISADGRNGKLPDLFDRLRKDGAKVIFIGYLHSPGNFSVVDHCKDKVIEYERRVELLASETKGIYYIPSSKIVAYGDHSYHWADMIHPSIKGSRELARRIVDIIRNHS